MTTFYGQAVIVELPDVRTYDPRTGWRVTKRWRGIPAAIRQKMQEAVSAGLQCSLEPNDEGGYDTLSASYGVDLYDSTNAALADQWTLQGNDLEKSIWEHVAFKAELAKITDLKHLAQFKKDIADLVNGEFDEEDEVTPASLIPAGYSISSTVIESFVRSLLAGVDSYLVSQYVLRHTVTVASGSSIRASYTGVGYVYSTAQIVAIENIPNNLIFSLPEGVWLKRTPTVDQVTYDRWQITQEWWHADAYDPFIYTPYS